MLCRPGAQAPRLKHQLLGSRSGTCGGGSSGVSSSLGSIASGGSSIASSVGSTSCSIASSLSGITSGACSASSGVSSSSGRCGFSSRCWCGSWRFHGSGCGSRSGFFFFAASSQGSGSDQGGDDKGLVHFSFPSWTVKMGDAATSSLFQPGYALADCAIACGLLKSADDYIVYSSIVNNTNKGRRT